MRAINFFDVLDLIVREQGWEIGPGPGEESLKYTDFWRILLLNEVTNNERKANDLWKQLHDVGVARKANQTKTYIVDIPALGNVLARKFPQYADKMRRDGQ